MKTERKKQLEKRLWKLRKHPSLFNEDAKSNQITKLITLVKLKLEPEWKDAYDIRKDKDFKKAYEIDVAINIF